MGGSRRRGSRHKARVRAVEILYEAEVRGVPVSEVIERRRAQTEPPINEFTEQLATRVDEHRARIDELLETYAIGWTLDRMPVVDRNILRIGVYELLWADGVAIAEAVAMAKELSTDESPVFVNGLLSRLMEKKPSLSL